jgi:hypothetical protein
LSGADGRCAGASDDEVFGVLGQWGVAGSWLEGRKLAVVRELIRRRPDERGAGVATGSGLPWDWDKRLAREVSLQLGLSVPAAGRLIWVAWALEARLPGIGKALDEGRVDPGQARLVVRETDVLADLDLLAAAEQVVLDGLARCRTWADLLRLAQRAVVTVDPGGARRRREQEEKENARVRFWREAAGTCALMGAGLPTDEALTAHARVEQRAQAYRAARVKRPIEILRVAAYLDLLNGVPAADRVARFQAEDQDQATVAGESGQAASDAQMRATAKRAAARADRDQPGNGGGPGTAGGGAPGDGDFAGAPGNDRASGSSDPGCPGPDEYPWDCPPDDDFQPEDYCPPEDYLPPDVPPCAGCGWADCRCGGPRESDSRNSDERDSGGDEGSGDKGSGDKGSGDKGSGDKGSANNGSGDNGSGDGWDDHGGRGSRPGGRGQGGGSAGQPEAGIASEVNLTLRHLDIPFLTAQGRAQRPGEARSLGVLDPALARRLAEAAARHPDSKFCVTIVDSEGHAIGHGCTRPRKPARPGNRRTPRKPRKGQRDGPPPPSPPASASASAFTFTPRDDPGPPGGFGSWLLTMPGLAGELIVDLHPVPTGECGHQYQSASHDPSDLLRHLVNVRDAKCGFPTCSRHARESDFEHAQPFDQGGKTCGCNCWACSRSCHQLKQSDGWTVTEVRPGYHQWITPSGRVYTQEPWQYPA